MPADSCGKLANRKNSSGAWKFSSSMPNPKLMVSVPNLLLKDSGDGDASAAACQIRLAPVELGQYRGRGPIAPVIG